jgi:hypothetical protein
MKDRDLLLLLAIVAVLWYLARKRSPIAAVTTAETYMLPDGTPINPATLNTIPGTSLPQDMAFWYSIMNLGPLT